MKCSKSLHSLGFVVLLCFAGFKTRADVTLTPATGATAISADSTGGAFTALTGPVLTEGATGDIAAGTIVLNCPAGFEFDTNTAVTVAVSGSGTGNDITLLSNTADITLSNITIQVTAPSDGTETSVLTFGGINARPTAGTPLASGTITESGTATFTLASIPADNYGALSEVAGTVVALAFNVQPGSAVAGAAFGTQPVVVTADQFGNASTSGLGANLDVPVALTAGSGPLQGTTTLDIGTSAGNGSVGFTDLQIDVAGAGKLLTASASGLSSATSSSFTVNHGAATTLVIQQQPSSSATAGVAFAQQPIVVIQDALGNLVDDDNSTVVTAARTSGSGTLQGTVNTTASGGVATFSDLSHNVAGNITITFSSGSLTPAPSGTVVVSPAAADHLVFTVQPGSATAGAAFGSQPSLISEDQFGNASAVGLPTSLNISVALSSGTGTLLGTTIQDIGTATGNGSVTFTDLRIDTAGSKQISASASGLTGAPSSSFSVSHAAAAVLAIQQQPSSSATAGVAFAQQPIVAIQDAYGNLVSDDNSTVVTAARNGGSGTLQGTLTATASGGLATFTDLAHNVANNITVTFSSGSLTAATSGTVTVSAAAADHLVFTAQPGSATAGSAFSTQPSLVSKDAFGNASAVGLAAHLNITMALTSGSGTLQGTTTQDIGTAAGNGSASFTDLRVDSAGSKQVTASASGLTSATSSAFSVSHAAASALTIQQQPSSTATAGVAFAQQPIIRIEDAFGNLINDDSSSVVTAARNVGSGALQGTLNATVSGGVATFTDLSHNVAGNITISFSSGSLTSATSGSVAVSPAAADHLVFTTQPGSAIAGAAFGSQPVLVSQDQFGNASAVGLPTNLNVSVTLSSGTGTLQGTTAQDIGTLAGNGTVTFTDLRIDTAGTKQLTASASGLTSATSSAFDVTHASASALTIQQQPSSTATAGVAFAQQPVVRIEDAFGNLINDDSSTVITANRNAGAGTLQGTVNATVSGGIATYTDLAHNVAGNISITFSSGSLTATTSSTVAVNAAAANHLVFTTQPGSATAGAVFGTQPALISQDPFGNASTVGLPANLNVSVALSSGSGTLQGATTQDIGTAAGNGTVAFTNLRIDTAGSKQVTASASGLTSATSTSFAVNHATASALTIQQQPSSTATAGVEFAQQPIVRIEDAFGNLINDDNASVVSAARNAGSGALQGTVNIPVSGGVATFTNLSHNVAGNITISFTSGSLVSATSSSIAINPAAADHLVFVAQPGSATAGSLFGSQPSIVSQDQFGNGSTVGLPTNLTVTMSLSSGTGSLLGTTTQDIGTAAGNGTVSFTDLEIDVAGTGKQLTASASGLSSATSSNFDVSHAAASTLVIQQQPSSTATAGVAFAQQPIVRIQDNYGNTISDDNSTVITAARNAGTGTLQGTVNATVSSGVATFTDLSHNIANNITISFTASGLTATNSSAVMITPGAADRLAITAQPSSATAGSSFSLSVVAQDQFGNNSIVGIPSDLNLAIALTSGSGTLQGTTTKDIGTSAGHGAASFANLRIDVAGPKQLTASASGLTSATTSTFSEVHAGATTLTIQQQPSSTATAGVAFAQQPIVRIEDNFGNVINDDNTTVVTAARNAGSGTLQGTLSQPVSGGVATFTNLSHNVAGNITIKFTSGSLASLTSTSITINPAPADHLVFTTQPDLATAGAAFVTQPSLISEDQFGNASAVGLPANLNVTATLSAGTGPLQGTTTQDIGTAAGNGSVTFTDLRIDVAGTDKQLTASASGLTSASSTVFAVNHAAASALVIQQQPSATATAGVAFAQQPIVAIQDAFGNLIIDDNSTVITAARNAGTGTLQGTLTATVSGGVASFANLAHNVAGNISITFSSGSLSTATSSSISINPASANHLVYTTQPGSATAGAAFGNQPSLISEDQFGNTSIVGLPSNLNVSVSIASGTGTLQGTTTQDIGTAAGNGTITFANLRIDSAGAKQLSASASGLGNVTSTSFTVNHAPASALAIQQQPSSTATAGVSFAQQPVVQIQDAFGNLINDDNSSVVTAARNAGSGALQGTLNMTVVGGVATYTNLSHNVAGNITIDFSSGSLSLVTSGTIAVSAAAADHLVFTTQPGSATAGSVFGSQPALISQDQFGNASTVGLPTSLNVNMALSSGTGTLQGTTAQDIGTATGNGTVAFNNLRIDTAGSKQLTASASGLTSAISSAFTVSHAPASVLTIQQQPSSTATAGASFAQQPIVRIEDAFGNLIDDDNSTVVTAARNAGSGTLQGTLTATASGGIAGYVNLSHNVTGPITILFTSGLLSPVQSSSITINPAPANHLVFVTQPGSATAGSVFGSQPSMKSKDVFGNDSTVGLPANLNVTVSLAAGTGPLQGTVTQDIGTAAGNGLVSFSNLRIDSAGNDKQLSAAASGLSSALSSVFVVNHAAATQLGIQTQPSSTAVAGQLFAQQPVIQIQDQFGNLISEDNATSITAALNSGTGTLQGTLALTASSGTVAYTNLSHNVANDITISFSTSGLAATNSSTVTITPAAADHLVFTSQPGSATAGSVFGSQPTLVARDSLGNNSSVGLPSHLNLTIALTTGTGTLQGTTTKDIGTGAGNGAATFTDLRNDVAGSKVLTATASGLPSATSGNFSVAHAPASTLTLQQQPSTSATAGVAFAQQPIVRIEDNFGNVITEDSSTIITAARNAGSGTLQGTVSVTAASGIASFANLSHNTASAITITFSGGSLASATSSTVNVSPAGASKLVIVTQPGATATAGQAFSPQPSVAIEDQFNNIITSDNTSLVVVTRTFGGALQGTLSATAANGVATFVNLIETQATTMSLDFTTGSLTGARSSSITVNPAAADHLTIVTQPSSTATAGTAFATQPVVQIQDQYNNIVTTDNLSVVTAVRSGGSGTLQGTTTATASSGVATFANLFHTVAGNITILFSSGGLSTTLSDSIQVNAANANHLVFTTQPSSATAGSVFGMQPVVRSFDAYGNASAAGLASSLSVSVMLQSGTGPLQGTTSLDIGTASGNGTVSFTNLRIDAAGTGKQLQASASGLTSVTSSSFNVAHATAAQLVIQTQPSTNATAGDILTNQPVIQIADNYGNTITEDNSTAVTASLHGGGTGLEGTLTLTPASGIVTFTNLSFDFAANVQLDFNNGSFPVITSDIIHVGPAAGSRLLIDTQPGATATAGQLFSPQPVVSLRDSFGNVITGDNTTQVTVSRSSGGTLLGTTTLTAVNGAFTFTDLAETVSGPTVLTFSSAGLSSIVSSSITVNPGSLAQLSVHTQPSSAITAGQQFPQQPVVWLTDAYGNLCITDNSTQVTASRVNGIGNLQGTTTITAVNGIVTYTNLTHFSATTMNLKFTAGSINATSSSVTVTAGPAAHVAFTQAPAGQAGHVLATQPIVIVTDNYGNIPTSIPASIPVTLTISSGSGNLFGTTTVDAGTSFGNGTATFTDLQINAPGTKQLTASASGLTSGVSSNFTLTGTAQPLASFGSASIGRTITSLWVGNFRGASTARDAVAVNHDDMMLTLQMSKDDGTFDTAATINLPAHPIAARTADLNGDGYDDIVVAYDDTNIVSVLLSTGSHGTNFAAPVPYVFSALDNPQATSMTLADLNGDGKTDLIITTAADNKVTVLFGTSGAAFTSPVTYAVGANPVWINVSDVDHDGSQDIVTANKDDGTISILYGNPGGTFDNLRTVTLGGNPQPVRVTTPDINRDGKLDLAVVNYASNTVSILVQQSNGSFLLSSNYTVGSHPTDFFLRDIDGDGFSDLAVLNSGSGTIDILFNRGTSNYVSQSTIAAGAAPTALFGGKFVSSVNLNGLLVADSATDSIAVYMFAGPTAVSSSINVNENVSGLMILGAHNPLFPQIYNFTIIQYPTNGTITGTPPTLTYTPNHEYVGADTLKFRADVNGVTSAVATVSISVLSVNHQPSFAMSTNLLRVLQGTSFSLRNFITSKNTGAPNESAQKIDYVVTNIDTTFYSTAPKIATNGTLTFKLAPLARGTNDLIVYAHDNGGVARGGTNISETQVLRIIALRHNHLPVVKAIPTVTLLEDSAGTNITVTVTDLDNTIEEMSITPVSLNEAIIPTANIAVSAPTTETNFTVSFVPAPDGNGLAVIQLQVFDGQDTTLATFKVNVLPVDDQPSFDLLDDDIFALQDSGTITVSNFCTSIYAGAANESAQVLTFIIGNPNKAAFTVQPTIDKHGTLKFRPAIGYCGTNVFSVCLKDNGTTANGGVDTSDTNFFSISITTNNFRHIVGTYNSLFYQNSGVDHETSGFCSFLLNYTRTFTGKVLIHGGSFPLSGHFDTNGFAEVIVPRKGGPSLDIQMQVDLTDGSDQVTGTVASDGFSSDLLGDRQPTTLPASITPGRYNVAFLSDGTGTNDLGGDAVGTVTVTAANRLTFAGTLPDRTIISQTIAVSKDGQWPLYVPLYAGAGSMIGWLTVNNDFQPIQSDVVSVMKESNIRNPFPDGFANQFTVMSSTNAPFVRHVPIISTNGIVMISEADILGNLVVPYSMTDDNFLYQDNSGHNVRLGFDHTFGYMIGTFIDPTTGLSAHVRGLLLPNVNAVRGYFYTAKPDPETGVPDTGEFFLQGN